LLWALAAAIAAAGLGVETWAQNAGGGDTSQGEVVMTKLVAPVYPPLARQARIQGTVVLHAVISKDGSIEGLTLISGHPMLAPAAIEAVKQWRYKPYLLNGEPVEVDTEVLVNFTLSGG